MLNWNKKNESFYLKKNFLHYVTKPQEALF